MGGQRRVSVVGCGKAIPGAIHGSEIIVLINPLRIR